MAFGFSTYAETSYAQSSVIVNVEPVVTGVQATGAIGNVSIKLSAVASVTGVSASLSTANVLVWSEIDTNQNPNWVEIAA